MEQIQEQTFYNNSENVIEEQLYENGEFAISTIHSYNSLNQIIKESSINANEEIIQETNYTYTNGNLVEIQTMSESNITNTIRLKYDNLNRILEERETSIDNININIICHDYSNSTIITKDYNLSSELESETIEYLDKNGNPEKIVEKTYSENISSEETQINTYDENQNLVKVQVYEEGNLIIEEEYAYDSNGLITGSVGIDHDSNQKVVTTYSRDKSGNLVDEKNYLDDDLVYHKKMQYNEDRVLVYEHIRELTENDSVLEEEFKYEVDYHQIDFI